MIEINASLLIQLINFLVLLFILNAILYKPILAKMKERRDLVEGDLKKAEELEQKVKDQEAKHQEELAKARQTAAQEKADLMSDAKSKEADILDKARAEASKIVEDMKSSIDSQAETVRQGLKDQMAPLAGSMAEKVLGRSVS